MMWKQDASGSYTRPMAGSESYFQLFALHGGDQLVGMIHASMLLEVDDKVSPLKAAQSEEAILNAWLRLRARYSILGVQPSTTPTNDHFTYRHPASKEEVQRWAKSTLFTSYLEGDNVTSDILLDKRSEMSLLRLPDHDGNAIQLHCFWARDAARDCITRIGFVFRACHTFIDGPGATTMLSELRQELANPSLEIDAVDWTSSTFREKQIRDLPMNATDVVASRFDNVEPLDIKTEMEQLGRTKQNIELKPPAALTTTAACISEHYKVSLTLSQTTKLRQIARKHNLSVSPILQAAAIARGVLEFGGDWPPKPDELYVCNWPLDSRPSLKEELHSGIMLAMDISHTVLPIGKRFEQYAAGENDDVDKSDVKNTYSKGQAEGNLSNIILALAKDANPQYAELKLPENRAARTKVLPEFITTLIQAIGKGEVLLAQNLLNCFSDAIIDRHITHNLPAIAPNGISSEIIDLDMSTNIGGPMILMRTWMFKDQTYLTADWSTMFWTRSSAQKYLNLWKEDVIRFIEEMAEV